MDGLRELTGIQLMTAHEFHAWLGGKIPQCVYYRGHLAAGRMRPENGGAEAVGTAAWEAHEAGLVDLVQRRNGDGCDYVSVKRRFGPAA